MQTMPGHCSCVGSATKRWVILLMQKISPITLLAQDRHCADALALKARIAAGANATDTSERLFHEALACDPDCGNGLAWACLPAAAAG